jgi:RHS repeat-associated protein
MQKRVAVGHPVDVATGHQFTAAHDLELPGYLPLIFRRLYDTSFLDRPPSPLGPGWIHNFEARLERDLEGFTFHGHDGGEIGFDDRDGAFARTGSLLNASASMELRREEGRLAVVHWHGPEDPVHRFVFQDDGRGRYRFVARELPSGHGLLVTHDARGRVATVTQTVEGRRLAFLYDDRGRLAELQLGPTRPVWSAELVVARYTYDGRGRLIAVHDAEGFARRYGYDEQGRLVLEQGRRGGTYRMAYDAEGRCIETSGQDGHARRRLIYGPGRFTRVLDSQERETLYQLNDSGQVEREIRPDGTVLVTTLDDLGRVVAEIDPLGQATTYAYDDRGNLARRTYPDGATVSYEYDDHHQPTRITEPDGAAWILRYEHRALVEQIDPRGRRLAYARDGRNQIVGAVTCTGNRLTITVDEAWTTVELTDYLGMVTRKKLDLFLNTVEAADARGPIGRFSYDRMGRLVEAIDGAGGRRRYQLDPEGELLGFIDARGARWSARYAPHGDCLERVDPLGRAHAYSRDTEGRLTAIRNPAGELARFEYDLLGRTVAIHHFDGGIERAEYDKAGRVVARTRPDGTVLAFQRDAVGNVLAVSCGGRALRRWKYDRLGNPVEAISDAGTVSFEYDPGGRLAAEVQNGRRIEYQYGPTGTLVRRALAGSKVGPLRFVHDVRGRLVSFAPEGSDAPVQTFGYGHDERVTARAFGHLTEKRGFDAAGRVRWQNVETVVSRIYDYDPEGGLVELVDTRRRPRTFRTDAAGQLQSSVAGEAQRHYRYDPNGNLVSADGVTLAYGTGNRLQAIGQRRLERDLDGQLVRLQTASDDQRLRWDPLGQLVAVEHGDGAVTTFGYDAFGRRVFKEHAGARTDYLWSGDDLLAEETGGSQTEYALWRAWPAAVWQDGAVRHVLATAQGVPRELVDGAGTTVWSGTCDDWGRLTREKGAESCRLRLPGQLADAETGLHYNRFRYYLPEAGQFISPDPLGFAAGANSFRYAPNPIDWVDPLGLECGRTDNHVFRTLSFEDREALARGEGISPRGTGGTIADQVAGRDTRYTSASETIAATRKYDSGNGLVAIGVDQAVAGGVGFVDHNNVMQAVRRSGTALDISNASSAREVMFKGPTPIPPTAITVVRGGK